MRVYHRLIHIRDQRERHEDVPAHILENPVFKLTTRFRQHVQARSAPISKTSKLVVDAQGMEIFGELAVVLREQGSVVMIYLVACILERLFGPDTIDDIESIRGDLSIPDIIDGIITEPDSYSHADESSVDNPSHDQTAFDNSSPPPKPTTAEWPTNDVSSKPAVPAFAEDSSYSTAPSASFHSFGTSSASPQPVRSAFSNLYSTPNAFTNTPSIFGPSMFFKPAPPNPVFATPTQNLFASTSAFGVNSQYNAFAPLSTEKSISATSPFLSKPEVSMPPSNADDSSMVTDATLTSGQPSTSPFTPPVDSSAAPAVTLGSHSNPSEGVPASAFKMANHFANPPRPNFYSANPLNPTAPTFNPIFKSISSPLRYSGVEQPFQEINDLPPPPPKPMPTSSAFLQSPNIINIPTASTPPPPSVPESNIYKLAPQAGKGSQTLPGNLLVFPNSQNFTNTPPRPQIDTSSSDLGAFIELPRSPLPQPPPLNKHQTISLPPTPTAPTTTVPFPLSVASKRPKSILDSLKGTLEIGVPAFNGALSPLVLSSPSTPRAVQNHTNGTPTSPSPSKAFFDQIASPLDGRAWISDKMKESDENLESRAINFLKTCTLVKNCFGRWRQSLIDKDAWTEACRRSDAYSRKILRQRSSDSLTSERKRRATLGSLSDTPLKKRARQRVSGEYKKPHVDEELARRFQAVSLDSFFFSPNYQD